MVHALHPIAVEQDGFHFAISFSFAARVTNDCDEPIAEDLGAAADVVAP
jgi:hypothetical protein